MGLTPPLLPPHPASITKPPITAAAPSMRLARGFEKSNAIESTTLSINAGGRSGASGACRKYMGTKPELEPVVVTVSVVPMIEQLPFGIEQVAVSVGLVVNPFSLI